MSVAANKALVNRVIDTWSHHDLDALHALVNPKYVHYTSMGTDFSFAPLRDGLGATLAAVPDKHYTVTRLIAEGDLVAAHVRATGTHQGAFFGAPPTGKAIQFFGVYHRRIADDTIVEDWDVFDALPDLL